MTTRPLFPTLVALGLAALGALAWRQHRAPERVRAAAVAAGAASADLLVREMG